MRFKSLLNSTYTLSSYSAFQTSVSIPLRCRLRLDFTSLIFGVFLISNGLDSFFHFFLSSLPFWPFLSSTMLVFGLNDGERWQDNGWLTSGHWRWSMWRESCELRVMSRTPPSAINHQRWMGILWWNGEPWLALSAVSGVMCLTRAGCWFGSRCDSRRWWSALCPRREARKRR